MSHHAEAASKTAEEIKTILLAVIKKENFDIGLDKNISSLGLDSVKILVLLQKLNKYFHIKLKLEDLFEHTSINSLAQFIDQKR